MRRRKRRKQRKIIILTSIALLFVLTTGYAAFQTNLNITAKGNIKYKTEFYVSTNGSDEHGNGTITKPYATINKAYEQVKDEATIYIMDTIIQNEVIKFTQGKNIHLTSYNASNTPNTIKKAQSLSEFLIVQIGGNLTLANITIDGNNISDIKGGIWISDATVHLETNATITNFNVNANTGYMCGAGIRVEKTSTLNINGGTISGNSAPCSGGIHNGGIINLNSGSITSNKAESGTGGGMDCASGSSFRMENGNISGNTASGHGGALLMSGGTAIINGGTIDNNTSSEGGAIKATSNSVVTINGGKITGNKSTALAGGIMIYNNSKVTMNGGEISENTAQTNGGGISVQGSSSLNHTATFILNGGSIKNNTAVVLNGGIDVGGTGTYTYQKGTVCGNKPTNSYETSTKC